MDRTITKWRRQTVKEANHRARVTVADRETKFQEQYLNHSSVSSCSVADFGAKLLLLRRSVTPGPTKTTRSRSCPVVCQSLRRCRSGEIMQSGAALLPRWGRRQKDARNWLLFLAAERWPGRLDVTDVSRLRGDCYTQPCSGIRIVNCTQTPQLPESKQT